MRNILLVGMIVAAMLNGVPAAAEGGRQVRIVNETGHGIEFIGVNASGDEAWRKNQITTVIRNGTSAQVSLTEAGNCRWDIRIAWGRKLAPKILKDVDLCSVRVLTLHYNQEAETLSYEKR